MKLLISKYIWVALFLCLPGCSKLFPTSIPSTPTGVHVIAGDSSATVYWDMVPGVTYFVYWAPLPTLTPSICGTNPLCGAAAGVTSPYVISNVNPPLTNGTTYSLTINGTINGGIGGPSSPSQQFTPQLAGTSWAQGTTLGNDLRGVTYGTIYDVADYGIINPGVNLGPGFVAVGTNGTLVSSADISNLNGFLTWTALANPLQSANLYAISNSGATYLAVGAGGTMLYSSYYALNWTPLTPVTAYDLYAVSFAGLFIAVGQNGTLLTSDLTGTIWTTQNSGTTVDLNGIAAGNGLYVAVGNAGTLLTSIDAANWTAATVPSSANLKSVTFGNVYSLITGLTTSTFVAVGSNGVVLTSVFNGINWTSWTQTTISSTQINAVTFGHQFVAVDETGNTFTSLDGYTWTNPIPASPNSYVPLNSVINGSYDYSAVGVGGITFHSI